MFRFLCTLTCHIIYSTSNSIYWYLCYRSSRGYHISRFRWHREGYRRHGHTSQRWTVRGQRGSQWVLRGKHILSVDFIVWQW